MRPFRRWRLALSITPVGDVTAKNRPSSLRMSGDGFSNVIANSPYWLSAHEWLEQWAVEENKIIVLATPENSDIAYTVVHVAPDGIVLNKGRTGAVYPVPTGVVLRVGDKVVVDRNGEICLPRTPEQGGGKKSTRAVVIFFHQTVFMHGIRVLYGLQKHFFVT